jgi:hypothetical protein
MVQDMPLKVSVPPALRVPTCEARTANPGTVLAKIVGTVPAVNKRPNVRRVAWPEAKVPPVTVEPSLYRIVKVPWPVAVDGGAPTS